MDAIAESVAWYVAFVFSASLHEASHAWVAKRGGDPTAYEGGQVSMDPVPHMRREPIGMIVLPLITLAMWGWPIGFASAPYDPHWAERHPKRAAWMALAGPVANLFLLIAAGAVIWLGIGLGQLAAPDRATFEQVVVSLQPGVWNAAALILSVLFTMNLVLFTLNLLPIPPLDGSAAVGLLLTDEQARKFRELKANPAMGWIGLVVIWVGFGALFDPLFTLALNVLYPGAGYH